MNARFTSNILLAAVGGFLLTASLTFGVANAAWIALGSGAAAFAIAAVGFPGITRGTGQRRLDALVALIGAWTVVESRVFDDGVMRWTSFGSGGALVVLAALGLVLHERDREARIVALTAAADPRADQHRNGTGTRSAVPNPGVAA